MQTADAEKRSRLLSLKLRALLRDHLGTDDIGEPIVFALGAGWVSSSANEAWLLVDGDASRALGPSLAVAHRKVGTSGIVNVLAERDTGILARRAEYFACEIRVWHVDDRTLLPAVPEPFPERREPRNEHLAFGPLIEACGAELVVEHGVVSGEVSGLEICRVVDDAATGVTRLEVGVGAHDREAFALVHGHLPTETALRDVVDAVARHRRADADPHPLNLLGVERLMRAVAIARPEVVGMESVRTHEGPVSRKNVKDAVPCVATAKSADGADHVVTFVHGVDLDAVPFAIDARHFVNATARTVVAARAVDMPAPVTSIAALAHDPVMFKDLQR